MAPGYFEGSARKIGKREGTTTMNLVLTTGELRVLDVILQRLSQRTEEDNDLVNVYQEDVELIESVANKVQHLYLTERNMAG